jgi:hypothetical protein
MKSTRIAKGLAAKRVAGVPTLLAGGNPQITKADGDAPVQAYIAAMPGWKSNLGRRLDALIVCTVPHIAVKSNERVPSGQAKAFEPAGRRRLLRLQFAIVIAPGNL